MIFVYIINIKLIVIVIKTCLQKSSSSCQFIHISRRQLRIYRSILISIINLFCKIKGCTKNKERVQKMMDLLVAAGLEGKPTLEKCKAIKQATIDKKEQEKQAKKEARAKHKEDERKTEGAVPRRMTRGATGVKPRQRIVISSDEEDDTPAARRTLSKLRSSVNDDSDSD
ncbi:hypothetical protein O3G_MSEX013338 [Manduca sexta]|uniref:Uncharacterized protein n=1 Tax=Manduca sexta TaxID=7130 RepID=A0A921ZRI9_MANSE|nr:hypothetical protein O3G_MSEX013338 [Manduca sexta]